MADCYICTLKITDENRSQEHIILNAMGGKLKSSNLLCRQCNSKIGHDADGELAKQFQFMSGYLQVKRDKGKIPITKGGKLRDGTEIELVDGITPRLAQPVYEATMTEAGISYNIVARDENEIRRMLNGIRKKYPLFNVEEAVRIAVSRKKHLRDPVSFSQTFGGDLAFRSIAKSAVNFYIFKNGTRDEILHLIPYIRGEACLGIVKHYHPKKNAYKRDPGEVIHLIHLYGNRKTRLLYCFVEFFSTHSYLLVLSSNYQGKSVSHTYAYNLVNSKEVKKKVSLRLSPGEINDMTTRFMDFPQIKEKSDRFMKIAGKLQTTAAINAITSTAINEIFTVKYGHEKVITSQMLDELSNRLIDDILKFFI